MRIAMLTSLPFPPEEGVGYYVYNLSRELMSRGHSVTVVTRGRPLHAERLDVGGIDVVRLPHIPYFPLRVHMHGVLVGRFLRPQVDEYDLFHVHSPLVASPPPIAPILTTIHTPMMIAARALSSYTPHTLLMRAQSVVSVRIERRLFARSQALVSVARSVSSELAAYGLSPESVAVMGNGVDPAVFFPGPPSAQPPVILYSGRLDETKGLGDLLDAMPEIASAVPSVTLRIVGKGHLRQSLEERSLRLGIAHRVEFVGYVSNERRSNLLTLYQDAAAYVQPSHYEGLPTSLLEAMSCARPCVATAVSGHLDVMRDGVNGVLVPPHAPRSLAAALIRVLSDRSFASAIAGEGRRTVEAHYTWARVADRYIEQYATAQERFAGARQ